MADSKRVAHFNLGLRLGWFQQGADDTLRPRSLMKDDAESMRSVGASLGYSGFDALVNSALSKLVSGPISSVASEAADLQRLFQNQSAHAGVPRNAAALNLGIVLGWLQQGAWLGGRKLAYAISDTNDARIHAGNAEYAGCEGPLDTIRRTLEATQNIRSALDGTTELIKFIWKQDGPAQPPADPPPNPPSDPPITTLEIHGTKFYANPGEVLTFTTNAPAAQVRWETSAPAIVSALGAGQFRGEAPGGAVITARYGNRSASASVVVRAQASPVLLRPKETDLVDDQFFGARVVRNTLLCRFKSSASQSDIDAMLRRHSLKRVGAVGTPAIEQLQFDPNSHSVSQMFTAVKSEAVVETVCPDPVVTSNTFAAHYPSEVPLHGNNEPEGYWALQHTESFAAFGLMQRLKRDPVTISFCEAGLPLAAAGTFDADFADRVKLDASRAWVLVTVGDDTYEMYQRPEHAWQLHASNPHGRQVVSVAASGWSNGGAVGVDPLAGIGILSSGNWFTFAYVLSAVAQFSLTVTPQSRGILCITTAIPPLPYVDTLGISTICNAVLSTQMEEIVRRGGLIVVTAGNQNRPIRDVGIVSAKMSMDFDLRYGVIVVGGTEDQPLSIHTQRERRLGEFDHVGSNYDPPDGGSLIDVSAPGGAIKVTGNGNAVEVGEGGTSLAAPFVAGAAAVIWSILPNATSRTVKQIIVDTSDRIEDVAPYADQNPSLPPGKWPRIYTTWGKFIGAGRVNLWQAVLNAVNKTQVAAGSTARVVGLRVRTPKVGTQLALMYKNAPDETILDKSSFESDVCFRFTRVTLSTAKPAEIPTFLRASQQTGSTFKEVYRRKLIVDTVAIDHLSPNFVITCHVFADGGVELKRAPDRAAPPDRARFFLTNTGTAPPPIDPDLLDPIARSPFDRSLRPWMKLADGDSYRLQADVTPPTISVQWLDGNLRPLTSPIDDEWHPYLTVPFGANGQLVTRPFFVKALFPSDGSVTQATVKVQVVSLNNELVKQEMEVVLHADEHPTGMLFRPPGWVIDLSHDVEPPIPITPLGCKCDLDGWTCRTHEGSEDGGGGHGYPTVTQKFVSPGTAAPGTVGKCTFRMGDITQTWSARLELPDVEWTCDQPVAAGVVVQGATVRATFKIKLMNHSRFVVVAKDVEAEDALLPAHAPVGGPATKVQFQVGDSLISELLMNVSQETSGVVEVAYAKSVLTLPAGSLGTRRIRMNLYDLYRNSTDGLPGPKYKTLELVVKIPLQSIPA